MAADAYRTSDIEWLRKACDVAREGMLAGNHPFGALLVDSHGEVLLTRHNMFTVDGPVGHAETNLAREAVKKFPLEVLRNCTLVTSVEPCCMCASTIYLAGIGAVVYGMSEKNLGEVMGWTPEDPVFDLPCRTVFGAGHSNRVVEVRGPYGEVAGEIAAVHKSFWKSRRNLTTPNAGHDSQ